MLTDRTRRILLVEDDPVDRMAFSRFVLRGNLPIALTAAGSRRAAESLLKKSRFDGVILDYRLGDGTALDLLPGLEGIPVVITSGFGSEEIAAATMKAGASDYIVKDMEGRYLAKLPPALEEAREAKIRQKRVYARLKAGHSRIRLINQELNCQKFALDEHSLVSITDLSGKILYVNGKFCSTSGYSRCEMLGKDHRIVNSGYHSKAFFSRMWATLREGEVWQGEIRNRAKDGSLYWVQTTIVPFRDVAGELTRFTSIRTDITEQKRFAMQLAEAKEAAERAAKSKSEFLANMSHEIRTPINGIMGTAELLRQSRLEEDQSQILQTLISSSDSLLTLVNDILDFSKIEAGMMTLESTLFSPLAAIMEVAELMEVKARSKGLELVVSSSPCLPRLLYGDPTRLKQVLFNLAGNALKFTECGFLILAISCRKAESGSAVLEISVRDSGIGIPSEYLGAMFEKFTQADASTTRKYGGTGLGLAISKKLVELMGGRLLVESSPGAGSTFHFEIECRMPSDMGPIADRILGLEGKRALLLNTGHEGMRILADRLEASGIRHCFAGSPEEAAGLLAAASEAGDPFHFALLDSMPPNEAGEWGSGLRSRGISGTTGLIYLVPSPLRGEIDWLSEAGFAACLAKPVATSEILDVMAMLLAAEGSASAPPIITRKILSRSPGLCGRPPTVPDPPMRFARPRRILLAEDNSVNVMIAARILETFGCAIDVARDGKEAVEMASLNSYDLILMDCHMPVMDGWEATLEIRKSRSMRKKVPIVALTADAMEGDRERCIEAGMDDYLSKPMKPRALWDALVRQLGRTP